jgi:NAD(P)-dependent dehydrogenase (short-subunit alcohol dehydrogenase family)
MHDLKDHVVLITGGAGGLGAATARTLADAGAVVVVADVRAPAAETIADEIRGSGGKAMALACDVRDPRAAEQAVDVVTGAYGRLDVLVNNAGTDVTLPVSELSLADWDRVLGVNLHGPFAFARAAFPVMRDQGQGQIVNVVSTAAKRAWANASAYHASKWGLLGLSHALHVEGRAVGVRVTAVIAGGMRTPFLLERFPDLDPAALQDPASVAATIRFVLGVPDESVIPEVTVIPMRETSWP